MRFFRYLSLLGAGCLVSMAIAYNLTRGWLRSDGLTDHGAPTEHRVALELRSEANELLDLAERFASRTNAPPSISELQPWLNHVCLPELKQLRGRVAWEERLPVEPVRGLEHAVELLLHAAENPMNTGARRQALEEVHAACDAVERYIAGQGVGRLAEPRRRLE